MSAADVEQGNDGRRTSAAGEEGSVYSGCSSVSVEVEKGEGETKVHLGKLERDCRICHLGLESSSHESGDLIELGCSCKGDLAAAHSDCAEAWFQIRGNKTCEICHSIAKNVLVETEPVNGQSTDANNVMVVSAVSSDARSFWHGHRFLNFLLACMVVAFVISWLFHFKMPSH